jgi:serine/threonine-protein kinase
LQDSGAALPSGTNTWKELLENKVVWELSPDFWLKYPPANLLGKGGFGEVWEVRDRAGGQSYAVKLLDQKPTDDTEIQALLQLWKHCPQFPRLHGAYIVPDPAPNPLGEEKPRYALMMDFVPGTSGRRVRLDREQVYQASEQLLEQLACMHSIGIVHRDIKPDNVLIEATDLGLSARLVDLGLACRLVDSIQELPVCQKIMVFGDRYFLAPELRTAGAHQNAKSDVWAMGVTLYYLAHPDKIQDILAQRWNDVQTNTKRLLTEINKPSRDAFEQLMQRMVDADPAKRPSAEQALTQLQTIKD